MTAATSIEPAAPATLWELENDLLALEESAELVSAEDREAYEHDLGQVFERSVEKRDRFGDYLEDRQLRADNIDRVIDRLTALKATYLAGLERGKQVIVRVIEGLGRDHRGKYRTLEGTRHKFSIRANPPSVDVLDERLIPLCYKRIRLTLFAEDWARIARLAVDSDPDVARIVERAEATAHEEISRSAIKDRMIATGEPVAGADLVLGKYSLLHR
jgi:Siphovirus Gp157